MNLLDLITATEEKGKIKPSSTCPVTVRVDTDSLAVFEVLHQRSGESRNAVINELIDMGIAQFWRDLKERDWTAHDDLIRACSQRAEELKQEGGR